MLLLIVLSASSALAAANTVLVSGAEDASITISANDLKPPECSGLDLTNIITGSGNIQGSNGNDLILGSASADKINAKKGSDCVLGGDGGDELRGGDDSDVLLGGQPVEHAIMEGPRGVKILPGASGVEALTQLPGGRMESFLDEVDRYCSQMDFVVIDTSPGISSSVLACLGAADEMLLVTNPEPTALTDAYALLKVISRRQQAGCKPVSIIMNQISSKEEAIRGYDRLRYAAMRFLGWQVEYLGSVAWDATVGEATRRQVDFLTHYADSSCTRDVRKIGARLMSAAQGGNGEVGRFFKRMMEKCDE